MTLTLVSERIECKNCGHNFANDEAITCWKCHSHICPKCGLCNCKRLKDTFPDGELKLN